MPIIGDALNHFDEIKTLPSIFPQPTQETSKRPVKNRLGIKSRLGLAVKNRIGSAVLENNDRVEIFECDDDSEAEDLRAEALKTIDLRSRISTRKVSGKFSARSLLKWNLLVCPTRSPWFVRISLSYCS